METNQSIQKTEVVPNSTQNKLPPKKVGRLVIKKHTQRKLDNWLLQISKAFGGIKLKRSDLVEWLLEVQGDVLSAASIKEITRYIKH